MPLALQPGWLHPLCRASALVLPPSLQYSLLYTYACVCVWGMGGVGKREGTVCARVCVQVMRVHGLRMCEQLELVYMDGMRGAWCGVYACASVCT